MVLYHSNEELIGLFDALIAAHPDWITKTIIGTSHDGRQIPMFKVGNPFGGKLMFISRVHGEEDMGTEVLYLWAKWLLESGDPTAIRILNGNCSLLVPILNIDRWDGGRNYEWYSRVNGRGARTERPKVPDRTLGQAGGVTTADGDATGTTMIDTALRNTDGALYRDGYFTQRSDNRMRIIGPAGNLLIGQERLITGWSSAGTFTLASSFGQQVAIGTEYEVEMCTTQQLSSNWGANLNRNSMYSWQSGGTQGIGGDYRGPYPASEPETQALRNVLQSEHPKFFLDMHFGGGYYCNSVGGNSTTHTNRHNAVLATAASMGITFDWSFAAGSRSPGMLSSEAASMFASPDDIQSYLVEMDNWVSPGYPNKPPVADITTKYFPMFMALAITWSLEVNNPVASHNLIVRATPDMPFNLRWAS